MKHLYKTKEGEILEAKLIDYEDNSIVYGEYNDITRLDLSEVQEVVLDKDGEPFMFDGEVVCVGDLFRTLEIIGSHIHDDEVVLLIGTKGNIVYGYPESCDFNCTHTPKHQQKKGIEKIDLDYFREADKELAEKLNELIEVVNNLLQNK